MCIACECVGRVLCSSEQFVLEHRAEGLGGGRPGALGLAEAEVAERGADVGHKRATERVCGHIATNGTLVDVVVRDLGRRC